MSDSPVKQVEPYVRPKRKIRMRLHAKIISIFISVMIIPIVLLTVMSWNQIATLGYLLKDISVADATTAQSDIAHDNIVKMTTDTASAVAEFLSERDQDVLLLANLMPSDDAYQVFSENRNRSLMTTGEWVISDNGMSWVEVDPFVLSGTSDESTNRENNGEMFGSGSNYRPPELFAHYQKLYPLYDEITFIDLEGMNFSNL